MTSFLFALLAALLLSLTPPAAWAAQSDRPPTRSAVEPAELARAVAEMEQLDRMRVSLASTLEGSSEEPTLQTMKEVCKPVGLRAMAIGKENGWQVRQVASKFRNPDHAPATAQERQVLDLFHRQPAITGLWQPAGAEQASGVNYYRRINVEPSCLACHGSKASRPSFVKDNYPADKAFDFNVGDLRGMYAVFIPELQQALAEAQN
ncbi:DUF3365 domain-containing protein [Synechococcus sp. CS-602]|uniref:Tll0287-like domain-containing protein n=1 Tax=Synechococcaceae TaxID=1890426 RepID=UPI0008FF0D9B|nr:MULTISPECIES: DUF3365 domain-containing protein [Synechococcaceae]MCT4363993.1 DUF3365 domain-containing protein [Candidatus Regnicoccus frigidus MAG-AL1]APD47185.1 hypothetical protein BM449_01200 [Synechococcus sp. SynAce01]MCT0201250.1 DUF3365 domain-containing protein [Synechococcus sp. CS-603]MCT0205634.1 DUF3365 domain-containing protein [Synechococcus sp. CS-602]MCT0245562.1 DUF3365 domain-containing protein [Synechococcus sp. CS-601]